MARSQYYVLNSFLIWSPAISSAFVSNLNRSGVRVVHPVVWWAVRRLAAIPDVFVSPIWDCLVERITASTRISDL